MKNNRRLAFTLIELLVVVAIIGTLIGLLIPAVMKARQAAYRTNCTIEIKQLDAACKAFYAKYSMYPPSRITIKSNMGTSDAQSQSIIGKMFPRIRSGTTWTTVNWGVPDGTLTGDQCLVFFLGGVNQKGFSTDPTNPGNTGVTMDQPFFNFQAARLVGSPPSYADYFQGNKYAFYSSYNGYANDCAGLMSGGPYLSGAGAFINPNTVQIISSGGDKVFGPGGVVLVNGGGSALPLNAQDDQANFSSGILGGY
jgi:prepilin-type N-terminal cleavage/methylation domain-containing protein